MPWVLFTIAQGAIEAVEINYIFVDKNQQTETDNIFFLTLKINSECHCRNMAILDLWNSVSSVNVIVQFDIKNMKKSVLRDLLKFVHGFQFCAEGWIFFIT